ncbi:AIR synthase family protein [Rufibacter sediminis]|uniref:AIR synthase n=1 Tax=Rufibacter sediminis TaxID=2762756 RepID=A0ABR6VPZ5_9BACT|nr:AIR synthase family protein [Rufibacter sediminis]MBC3539216.1 AIR synthase [Rufibacter sediminis]
MNDTSGKISHVAFEQLVLSKCGAKREEVRVGPYFGVDVSLIDLPGQMAMAVTSDPLSLIPSLGLEESAWLSVHLMANDMATTGFAPMYGQFVLNLPAAISKNDFKIYWEYIDKFCTEIGLAITGGHTGFMEGQNSTIAGGGTFITVAPKAEVLVSQYAQAGNSILVTKEAAISSSAILAMSFPETVRNKIGIENYQKACSLFYQTSSLKDALTAVGENRPGAVTAMHDVTEGGLLGAIYELACASGNGAVIYNEQLPVGHVQHEICRLFSIDPRYSVGAGSMIICCQKGTAPSVIERLRRENIPCVEVGEIKEKDYGIKLTQNGVEQDLVYQAEDPYWAAFFNAYKAGWK